MRIACDPTTPPEALAEALAEAQRRVGTPAEARAEIEALLAVGADPKR